MQKRGKTKEIKQTKRGQLSYLLCTDRNEMGLRGLPTWTDIGLAPIGFVVYLILAFALMLVFNLLPWFDANQIQETGLDSCISIADAIIAYLKLAVIAPIIEEIIFRGWLYGKLRNCLLAKFSDRTSMLVSIFIVSLVFGMLHGQWNAGVNMFAMSIVLCGLRETTGTIYSGILMHIIKNGVAFCVIMFT